MQQKAIFTFLFLSVVTLSFSQSNASDTTRILFIGNSYTYYNSTPELLKGMAKETFPNHVLETQLVSRGGMTLARHWEEGRALSAIQSRDWDYVVLQEQSKMGMPVLIDHDTYFGNTDLFFEYARKFDAAIKAAEAKTVFFMTWSVIDRPAEQAILTHAYTTIAKELGALLSPVGLAWDIVRNKKQINLYSRDGSHPSDHGSYLVASTLFSTLFKQSPVGLSGNISGFPLSGSGAPAAEQTTLVDIPANKAELIQQTSWAVSQSDYGKAPYPEVKKPQATYTIPSVKEGEPMQLKDIIGRWYGNSTYSNDYFGVIIDLTATGQQPKVNLSMYSADRQDKMPVSNVKLTNNNLLFTVTDSLRGIDSDLTFSFTNGQLNGVSKSFNNKIARYKHWDFSKEKIQNGRDLAKVDALQSTFQADIKQQGYVKAALDYYAGYSNLIGEEYRPEEMYLDAMGGILLGDKKVTEALQLFELATVLYPQSVNVYLSYGEALVSAGQHEKGIRTYTTGYDLAKKTKHRRLASMEANLEKLKSNAAASQRPGPPPPPRKGGR